MPLPRTGLQLRRTGLVLVGIAAGLVVLSALTRVLAYRREVAAPGIAPPWWLPMFDVNSEANVPTWFSVGLLLAAAGASFLVGALHLPTHRPVGRLLLLLGLGLVALSLDELTGLHERLGGVGAAVGGSVLHFAWVVPGAVLAAVGLVVLLRGLRRLRRGDRTPFVAAALVYLGGALVLETVSGLVFAARGDRVAYLVVTAGEEFLEMCGAVLLLVAVLRLVRRTVDDRGWRLEPRG